MEYHKSVVGYDIPIISFTGQALQNLQKNRDSGFALKNINRKSRLTEKYDIVGTLPSTLVYMNDRHILDSAFVDNQFDSRKTITDYTDQKYMCDDSPDIVLTHASYTNIHIPLQIRCLDNYKQAGHRYEAQFQKEVQGLVDNQATALDACHFVRLMSYTTLWPPLHSEKELNSTSKNFFKLNESEKTRLKRIMTTNIT